MPRVVTQSTRPAGHGQWIIECYCEHITRLFLSTSPEVSSTAGGRCALRLAGSRPSIRDVALRRRYY